MDAPPADCSGLPFPRVLVAGPWEEGRVTCRIVPSTRRADAAVEQEVERTWRRLLEEGVPLFDGAMCRLEGWEVFHVEHCPNKPPVAGLRLDLSRTSYKAFAGTNLHGCKDLPPDSLARPVGVSPLLVTADGFLLFGRRNASVAYYPHRLHPFSGALEWPRDDSERPDVFAECRRELAEELSLSPSEVPELAVLGIVEDPAIRHPEVILHAGTICRRADLEARLDPGEHSDLVAIPATRQAVEAALREPEFTPVARAALWLWTQIT